MAISLDECRQELWSSAEIQDGPGGINALLKLQNDKIFTAMEKGRSIVVHNTNPLKIFRAPLIELGRKSGYQVQIIYFDVPPEECKRRNIARPNAVPEDVMDDYIKNLEVPEKNEA
jgi:predicted kinase